MNRRSDLMITSKRIIKLSETNYKDLNNFKLTNKLLSTGENFIHLEFWIHGQKFFYSGTSAEKIKNEIIDEIAHYKGLVKEYNQKYKDFRKSLKGTIPSEPSVIEERLDRYENTYEQLPLALDEYLRQVKSKKIL
jgi:hypothetical protein